MSWNIQQTQPDLLADMKIKHPKQILYIHTNTIFSLGLYPMVQNIAFPIANIYWLPKKQACLKMFLSAHGKYQEGRSTGLEIMKEHLNSPEVQTSI